MAHAKRSATPSRVTRRWWFVAALVVLAPVAASAQDAELQGVVRDQSGAVVPGASVAIVAPANNASRRLITDAAGHYVFSFLAPGDYDVTAELNGFQPVTRTGVSIDSGSRISLDLVLRPAHVSETIAVAAAAPAHDSPGDAAVIGRD